MDLAHNTASIAAHDPKFARTYLVEKQATIEVMTRAHPMAIEMATRAMQHAQVTVAAYFGE
jgi:hypothetical protein